MLMDTQFDVSQKRTLTHCCEVRAELLEKSTGAQRTSHTVSHQKQRAQCIFFSKNLP